MRFIGITATLQLVVPYLHRHIIGAGHELSLTDLSQVSDVALVCALILEGLLEDDDAVVDGHLLDLAGVILR